MSRSLSLAMRTCQECGAVLNERDGELSTDLPDPPPDSQEKRTCLFCGGELSATLFLEAVRSDAIK